MPRSSPATAAWRPAAPGLYQDEWLAQAGWPHGATTRELGNMKDPAARAEALSRAGLPRRRPSLLRQVHGTDVMLAKSEQTPGEAYPEGDGWITDQRGPVLSVYAADCVPLFVWEPSGKACGLFHSGWRGTHAGMPRKAVSALCGAFGLEPESLRATIGPHIRSCCYKVGPEFASKFRPESLSRRKGELHLDLEAEARAQLAEAGLPADRVGGGAPCTHCAGSFYSFRREKADVRLLAFLALP